MIAAWAEFQLDRLRAELAAGGRHRDISQALWAGLGGRRFGRGWVELLEKILRWQHEEEVDDKGEDDEVDDGGKEVAVHDLAAVYIRDEVSKVRFANDRAEQRLDDVFGKSRDDGCKRCADDDGYRQIHHITAQDEIAKSFKHGPSNGLKSWP